MKFESTNSGKLSMLQIAVSKRELFSQSVWSVSNTIFTGFKSQWFKEFFISSRGAVLLLQLVSKTPSVLRRLNETLLFFAMWHEQILIIDSGAHESYLHWIVMMLLPSLQVHMRQSLVAVGQNQDELISGFEKINISIAIKFEI